MANHFSMGAGNILFGNGSDELITYLVLTFGGFVLYPAPTFSMYGIISKAVGERPHRGAPRRLLRHRYEKDARRRQGREPEDRLPQFSEQPDEAMLFPVTG
ncbi:MAG: hypothetical protein MZU97_08745 [Bacillus subtilis]|nr:hypothetical protein [Bacillus subtilis]